MIIQMYMVSTTYEYNYGNFGRCLPLADSFVRLSLVLNSAAAVGRRTNTLAQEPPRRFYVR